MLEREVEAYLKKRVKELGGEVRKVQWIGRRAAPDRLVMLPEPAVGWSRFVDQQRACTIWVELKNPKTILTFPANPHERQQAREHERMRAMGQRVEVIGTTQQVDEVLA